MAAASIGNGWEGKVVDGTFPLLERLDGSENCASFLTLLQGLQEAVIQLILMSGPEADAYLAQWDFAKALSHPHLIRVISAGRCTIDSSQIIYVVTERPHATLAKILQQRTLNADAAREMFIPVLDALRYLHENRVVHGHVSPSNILLADSTPKLSATDLLVAGSATRAVAKSGGYDAPELSRGVPTAAADIWSLGVTLWEAMTQSLPITCDSSGNQEPVNASSPPHPFREIVLDCLHVDPLHRSTIQTIIERLEASGTVTLPNDPIPVKTDSPQDAPPEPVPAHAEKIEAEEVPEPAPFSRSLKSFEEVHSSRSRAMPFALILLAAIAIGSFLFVRGHPAAPVVSGPSSNEPAISEPAPKEESPIPAPSVPDQTSPASAAPVPSQAASETSPEPETQSSATQKTETEAAAPVNKPGPEPPSRADRTMDRDSTKGLVAKRVLPAVSPSASNGMRRRVEVVLRVSVNRDGEVSAVTDVSLGPGNYFARISERAARSWKFTPPKRNGDPEPSVWTLRFNFEREKTEATATEDRD